MTEQTAAMPRYCKSCGYEIEWWQATWIMNRDNRIEYYHVGCDLPPGFAVVADSSLPPATESKS